MWGTILLVPALVALSGTTVLAQPSAKAVAPNTVLADVDRVFTDADCSPEPKLSQKIGPFRTAAAFVVVNGWGSTTIKGPGATPPASFRLNLLAGGQIVSSDKAYHPNGAPDDMTSAVGWSFILYKGHSLTLQLSTEIDGVGSDRAGSCYLSLSVRALSVSGNGVPPG